MTKKDVLKNPIRKQIYQTIKAYPGVHFSIIKKKITPEGSTGQFVWHLEVLLKYNCIKKLEIKKYSLFLPYDMDEEMGRYYFLLRDSINRKIITYLSDKESAEQVDVYQNIGESKGSVIYHIKTLVEYNLVKTQKLEQSRSKLVLIDPEKKRVLLKISSNIKASDL